MNTTTTLPDIAAEFLALSRHQQQALCRNDLYDFEDHGERWVRITDHYRSRDAFYAEMVTVHTLNAHGHPSSSVGVPLTPDYRLLLSPSAQFIRGIEVIQDHDTITRIDLPDGTTLTGEGRHQPWRDPLFCTCDWCESQRD